MEIFKGLSMLLVTLALFSVFSFKAPKGQKAMSGLAGAAVASYLVEAIHKYISGDFAGIAFLGEVGHASGGMGGVAAAALVPISMGVNPVLAITAGAAMAGYGILPGFVAGYAVGLLGPVLEKKVPKGLDIIVGAILIAPFARGIAFAVDPIVNSTLLSIGTMISTAADQSPILMGFILGGIIKVVCSSPLSAMALTAMLGLQGLAMGIAAIACVGGAFTDGIVFKRLRLGEQGSALAVIFEPLTQAHIISANPLVVYGSNFFGGAFMRKKKMLVAGVAVCLTVFSFSSCAVKFDYPMDSKAVVGERVSSAKEWDAAFKAANALAEREGLRYMMTVHLYLNQLGF